MTIDDVRKALMDFWDQVLEPVMATKDDLKGMGNKLRAGQKDLQRQINDLKLDTPNQREFDKLKERVDRFHPTN